MTFKELITNVEFKHVWKTLKYLYPDAIKSRKGYENTWNELQSIKRIPKTSDMTISISHIIESDGTSYYSVDGLKENDNQGYALDFSSFREWLSFEINEEVYKHFYTLDIIAHCLWEMTFHGYSNKTIIKESKKILTYCKNIKKTFKVKL